MLVVRDLDTGSAIRISQWQDEFSAAQVPLPAPISNAIATAPVATMQNHTSRRELIKQTARRALGQTRTYSELSADALAARGRERAVVDEPAKAHHDYANVPVPSSITHVLPSVPVRVTPHKKNTVEFRHLRRFQLLKAHTGPVRVLAQSPSGLYLASGGADALVHIWRVSSRGPEYDDGSSDGGPAAIQFPQEEQTEQFLRDGAPCRTYHGHSGDILSLSWSKNDFLLTGGLDGQMMLWHPSAEKHLRSFPHHDFVTALTFHPLDEQICVSGTASGLLRMWHLKERKLLSEAATEELITATTISPDGKTLLAGTDFGRCKFYTLFDEIQGEWQLIHTTQMDVRSSRGKNRKGAKITGIVFSPHDANEVLMSSNDSRLRRYRMEDKSIFYKYTGHTCVETKLRGTFSPCGQFVMTASENKHIYIWKVEDLPAPDHPPDKQRPADDSSVGRRDRNFRHEAFMPHDHEYVSEAQFALSRYYPSRTSADPSPGSSDSSGLVIVTGSEMGYIGVFVCL
jgi:WD40 repeat protein